MPDFNLQGIGMTSQRTRDRLLQRLRDQGIRSENVLEAMRVLPRHVFVDEALAHRAYEDTALPIGHGQTISQPYVVARMSELLLQGAPRKVLEIGTGCGYQTALLAACCERVYSVERIAPLHAGARARLAALGIRNASLRLGDGYAGWERFAPFDAIMVTAAPSAIPEPLLRQLAAGGRLVLPVGGEDEQQLRVVEHTAEGTVQTECEPVRFVPLQKGVQQ